MEPWGAALFGDPCRECGFAWSATSAADAVSWVHGFGQRIRQAVGSLTGDERLEGWSVAEYVSHVGDNLHQWSERVQAARLAGQTDVSGYDPDALATARRYESIPLAVALWSADNAATHWVEVLIAALDEGVELQHETRGLQRADDIARNNCHDAYHHLWDIQRIAGRRRDPRAGSTCQQCGLDIDSAAGQAAARCEQVPRTVRRLLIGVDSDRLMKRPSTGVWSPLEYAAHLGEALDWYAGRIERVLKEEHAQLHPWDPDKAAFDGRYLERSIDLVLDQVEDSSQRLATLARSLTRNDWMRSGIGADGTPRTVEQLLGRAVHELVHHERDIIHGLSHR